MSYLSKCDGICRRICLEAFPAHDISAEFGPNLDLKYGDISSTIFQKLGAHLRTAPIEIAKIVLPRILQELPGAVVHDDFLNLQYEREQLIEECISDKPIASKVKGREVTIVIPPPHSEISGWPYVRLCAAALWQGALYKSLGASVGIVSSFAFSSGSQSLVEIFKDVIDAAFSDSKRPRQQELSEIVKNLVASSAAPNKLVHLWLSTRSLPRNDFTALVAPGSKSVEAHFPEMDWFRPWEDEADHLEILKWNQEEFVALLYYLMRPVTAAELDLAVPRLKENANLRWFLGAMVERISRLSPDSERQFASGTTDLSDFEPFDALRGLLIRERFFGRFLEWGAIQGGVREYFTQFEDYLRRVNVMLNSPRFRIRLEQSGLSEREHHFVTGIRKRLSDMLTIDTFFE